MKKLHMQSGEWALLSSWMDCIAVEFWGRYVPVPWAHGRMGAWGDGYMGAELIARLRAGLMAAGEFAA